METTEVNSIALVILTINKDSSMSHHMLVNNLRHEFVLHLLKG